MAQEFGDDDRTSLKNLFLYQYSALSFVTLRNFTEDTPFSRAVLLGDFYYDDEEKKNVSINSFAFSQCGLQQQIQTLPIANIVLSSVRWQISI